MKIMKTRLLKTLLIMRNKSLFIAALAAGVIVTGCNKQPNSTGGNPAAGDTNSASVTQQLQNAEAVVTNAWQKTKEATSNAWTDVKASLDSAADYTYDQKGVFVTNAAADLQVLDDKIQQLSDRAATASDSVKADAQARLQALHAQRTVLAQKLDDAKQATEANWNDAKTAFKNSYAEAKNSLKEAWQWLNDKMNS